MMRTLLLVLAVGLATAQVIQVKLPYALDSLEPKIDNKTMHFHYGTHYKGYVDNLNKATAAAAGTNAKSSDLTTLVKQVKSYNKSDSRELFTAIRNQAGGAWNHALYFKHLAPPGTAKTDPQLSLSKELSAAIDASFGSLKGMMDKVTERGMKVFGSGWSWLCLQGDKLVATSTPNQDNPLMGNMPGAAGLSGAAGCTPILGLDVWEHAYYLKHGPKRADYVTSFWSVVDWDQVSKNYAAAKAGKVQALVE